jgi:hypothetical protein
LLPLANLFSGKNRLGDCWEKAIKKYMEAGPRGGLEHDTTPLKRAKIEEPTSGPETAEVVSCTPGEDETVPDEKN